jgi:hypothetical protein
MAHVKTSQEGLQASPVTSNEQEKFASPLVTITAGIPTETEVPPSQLRRRRLRSGRDDESDEIAVDTGNETPLPKGKQQRAYQPLDMRGLLTSSGSR